MGGGLLNLLAYGNKNIILNGNPSKTFFKTTYAKYTNFGLQKFRVDFHGQKILRERTPSIYEFTIPKYADLLMDIYLVINLPHIWSPLYMHNGVTGPELAQPYEFKWIENLGAQLIKRVSYSVGGILIQEFTGAYLYNMVQRDFSETKKKLFDEMTGNVPELNDPANYSNNYGNYPTVVQTTNNNEPSIRGRKLYIPINLWHTFLSSLALPLLCMYNNQIRIKIECRPIRELFMVRDIDYYIDKFWDISLSAIGGSVPKYPTDISYSKPPYVSTMNLVEAKYQMYLFLTQNRTGLYSSIIHDGIEFLPNALDNWYADPHLLCTYVFLDANETNVFISKPQKYLIKEVHETKFTKSAHTQNQRVRFTSTGLVTSWMWFFQRNDTYLRNTWSNYTNWPYNNIPHPITNLWPINSDPYAAASQPPCKPCCQRFMDISWGYILKPPYFPLSVKSNTPLSNSPSRICPSHKIDHDFIIYFLFIH